VAPTFRSAFAWICALLLFAPFLLRAQQPNVPHLGYVFPAGGQQATIVRVTLGGRALSDPTGIAVSGGGVDAAIVEYSRPLTPQQITALRQKLQQLQAGPAGPAAQREIRQLRQQINDASVRNRNPVLAETVTVDIMIAADAAPGARHLRLLTATGVSRPLVFHVGQLTEVRELPPPAVGRPRPPVDLPTDVDLPVVVNGQLIPVDADPRAQAGRQAQRPMNGDADRYRFRARAGQQMVIAVEARSLLPYLADAVPGWFQAVVTVLDAEGHELAATDDFRFDPDPALLFRVPHDGDFIVEIADALSRGREDFVYRMAIGEIPYVTSIFPLGGRSGAQTRIEATGWNLDPGVLTLDGIAAAPGLHTLAARRGTLISNPVPVALDDLPESLEREPNDSSKDAATLSLPHLVNGRISRPGDVDVFTFKGRAGDTIVAEVTARRLHSPLDSALELTDASGRQLAFNDDRDDRGAGLLTHHADSWLTATLPADGTYAVRLIDIQSHGGPEYGYRLRVSGPRPDFSLRVAPSAINAPPGATVPVTVSVTRKDGFAGDVAVTMRAAEGFVLSGATVPAGLDAVRMTITVPPNAYRQPLPVEMDGHGIVDGRTVTRAAVASDELMQAFAYTHFVPADTLAVHVAGRGRVAVPARLLSAQPLRIPAGGAARVRVALPPLRGFQDLGLELDRPPHGISLGPVTIEAQRAEFEIRADSGMAQSVLRGNLIVIVSGTRVPPPNATQTPRRQPLGFLPAIAFEAVAPRLIERPEPQRPRW
jgi:hypothetical protein